MVKSLLVILSSFIVFAVASPRAISQSKREVPSRKAWNITCMSNALERDGEDTPFGKHWGSSVDKAFAQSFCTCRHEYVKNKLYIDYTQFAEAWQKCRDEFAANSMTSITKYLQIHLLGK